MAKKIKKQAVKPRPKEYLLSDYYDDDYIPGYADGGWFNDNWKDVLKTGAGVGAMFIPGMQGVGAGLIGSGVGGMIGSIGEGGEEDVNYINDAEAPKVIGTKYNTPNVMSFQDGGPRKVDAVTGAAMPINEEAYYYNEFFGPIADKMKLLSKRSKKYGNTGMDLKATAAHMDLGDYSDEPNLYKLKGIRPELGDKANTTQEFINSLSDEQVDALAKTRDKGIKGNMSLIKDLKLKPDQILPALTAYRYGKKNEMFQDGGKMPLVEFEGNKHEEGGIQMAGAEVEGDETMYNNVVNSDREYMEITEEMAKKYRLDKKAVGKTPAEYSKLIEKDYGDNEYFGENTRMKRLDNLARLSIDLAEKRKQETKGDDMNKLADGGPGPRNLSLRKLPDWWNMRLQGYNMSYPDERLRPISSEYSDRLTQFDGQTPTDDYFDDLFSRSRGRMQPGVLPRDLALNGSGNRGGRAGAGVGVPQDPRTEELIYPEINEDAFTPRGVNLETRKSYSIPTIAGNQEIMSSPDDVAKTLHATDDITMEDVTGTPDTVGGVDNAGNIDNDNLNLSNSEGLTDLMGLAPIALEAFSAARAGNRTPEEVRYKKIRPQELHPDLIDPTYTLQNVEDTYNTALEGVNQVSKKDYLRRRTQMATEEAKTKGQALGQIRNANKMMLNQADQYNASQQLRADSINAELGMRVEDINAANEAAVESTRDMHLSNMATMLGQSARDAKLGAASERYNDRVFDILPELYPGLKFNRQTGYSPDKLSMPVDTSSVYGGTGMDVPQYSVNNIDYDESGGPGESFEPSGYGYRLPYSNAGYLREPNIGRRLSLNPYTNQSWR